MPDPARRALALPFVLAWLAAAAPVGAQSNLRGDVDGSEDITALDALGVLSHVVGRVLPGHFTVDPNGDANCDDTVAALDALIVLSFVVGRDVSAFCVGESIALLPFITTWATTAPGQSISIPTVVGSGGYDFIIGWGDGAVDTVAGADPDPGHVYAVADTYAVEISGMFPQFSLGDIDSPFLNEAKLQSVEQWGTIAWESMSGMFFGAENLVLNATDVPDLSGVTDLSGMFWGATSFDGDIGSWDVSNVTTMASMFRGAAAFDQDIGAWVVGSVTDMSSMFLDAAAFDQDLGAWDVSSVTTMESMFSGAVAFDQDLGGWDVSGVDRMHWMFFGGQLSLANYDGLLTGWSTLTLQTGIQFHAGSSRFCALTERQAIIDTYGWLISDGGLAASC